MAIDPIEGVEDSFPSSSAISPIKPTAAHIPVGEITDDIHFMVTPATPDSPLSIRDNIAGIINPANYHPNAPRFIPEIMKNHNIGTNGNEQEENENTLHENREGSLNDLKILRNKYPKNPIIAYLNINSLRGNKLNEVREICKNALTDIFCIDETKLTTDFPTAQFHIDGYQSPPFRRDRAKSSRPIESAGGGKIVYVRLGLIVKRLEKYETLTAETICLELTLSNKKWFIIFAYRPESICRTTFFTEISNLLDLVMNKYDNVILAGDLNIDMDIPEKDVKGYLKTLCVTFDLHNLINKKTCSQSNNGSSLDVLLTNRPRCFHNTSVIETGVSDHHKLVMTFMRSTFQKLEHSEVYYRDYKYFNDLKFLKDLQDLPLNNLISSTPEKGYDILTEQFLKLLNSHAPRKMKKVRGNQASFMNKEYSKTIMNRSKMRNKYNKWKSRENYLAYQRAKYSCKKTGIKTKQNYYRRITQNGFMTNKLFWNTVKPLLTNKGNFAGGKIVLEENDILIHDEKILVEIFNDYYINIVENTTNSPPVSIGDPMNQKKDFSTVENIIKDYQNHPSIIRINHNIFEKHSFSLPKTNKEEINKIIKSLDITKATGPDDIPAKIIKLAADVVDAHLAKIINCDIETNSFSENAKTAYVSTIHKKNERTNKINYRPVSVLNTFSKICEKYIQEKITPFLDTHFSVFLSAYRKKYSTNHVLIRMIENWKKHLDDKKCVGAVLMDLSKAFDCIPHDLLIAKMHAYGFDFRSLIYFYSYLKRRKQSVKINNTKSSFQVLKSGIPQGSILGPIFFNLFMNDLFMFMKNSDLENFADDNTISAFASNFPELTRLLESESNIAINWFKNNGMTANADKFQAIFINRCGRYKDLQKVSINNKEIQSKSSVESLGINIDNKLNFKSHINILCKKAAGQLNAISRIGNGIGKEAKKVLIQSFILSNFNYCPLVWMHCSNESINKVEKIQERALRLLNHDYVSDYDALLCSSESLSMKEKRIKSLATEIFKTLNDLNPPYMKEIFIKNNCKSNYPDNLRKPNCNFVTYGENSLKFLGPKIWNSLPAYLKQNRTLSSFKKLIKMHPVDSACKCSLCRYRKN